MISEIFREDINYRSNIYQSYIPNISMILIDMKISKDIQCMILEESNFILNISNR